MTIKIHITLIFFLVYNFFIGKFDSLFICYMFIVMHELSHMIVALCLNVDIIEIELMPFGINAKYKGRISLAKELLIGIAGPVASICFAIIYNNEIYCLINLGIALFNLIPIYPLDGGRILKSLFKLMFGENRGATISIYITNFLVIAMLLISLFIAAYYKNFIILLMSLYLLKISKNEIQKDKIIRAINYLQIDK